MLNRKGKGAFLLAFAFTLVAAAAAPAQDSDAPRQTPPPRPEVNHEVLIHLLATAEGTEGGGGRVPQALEGVVRQLKATLPSSDYRLAATFVNRVRDGATFDIKTAGGGPLAPTQNPLTPTFFQISLTNVRLIDPASAQPSINIQHFRLGMKVPIQMAAVAGDKGQSYPVINYEDVGVTTQLSVREGEPTLVGTLNSGRAGQLFVIVITVRRTK